MRFASSSLQCLAAAAAEATMSSSRASSRGLISWRRGFSDRPSDSRDAFVSGDSHFRSVRDANYGYREEQRGNFGNSGRIPQQNFRPLPPFRQPQPFRQSLPPRARRPKPSDYRNWEYALSQPPSHCERFVVLSYNILADYLAINHGELYFHIPPYILDWERRKRSIMFELGLWSPDIMCFQEVDRFQDLEEGLKLQGYDGIWKMRTGIAVDGCAVFWRTRRFKLLHEEYIEFNKLGLRDNVAQICVLESKSSNAGENGSAAFPTSSAGANRVVICNIHVLYNPRRGEIKVGQVRVLLNRAHAVSKIWNDAPVVICGDFNCTPKSPLYNFISEQKLDLSGLARDKVSGQSSAEIVAPRTYSPKPGYQSASNTFRLSPLVDDTEVGIKQSNCLFDMHEQNKPHSDVESAPLLDNLSQSQSKTALLDICHKSCSDMQFGNKNNAISDTAEEETQDIVDGHKDEICSTVCVLGDCSKGNPSTNHKEGGPAVDLGNDEIHEFTLPITSCHDEFYSRMVESGHGEKGGSTTNSIPGSSSEQSQSNLHTSSLVDLVMPEEVIRDDIERESVDCDVSAVSIEGNIYFTEARVGEKPVNAFISDVSSPKLISETSISDGVEVSPLKSSESLSPELAATEEKDNPSTPNRSAYQVKISDASTSIDLYLDQKLVDLSLDKLDEVMENERSVGEDRGTFLSELCNNDDVFTFDVNCDKFIGPDSVGAGQSSEACVTIPHNSQLNPAGVEIQDDSPPSMSSEPVIVEKYTYDPSLWTPMEIETASGHTECTLVEHPLKLKSTYAEVEDYSGTRDSSREPQVTSYNRRFLGTVDYIWCSEGLQTVKVLDTIPKHVLRQQTPGFPTKKWGSDHIALACQVAFTKDANQS